MSRRIRNEVWLWGSVFATIALVFGIWGRPAHAEDVKPTQPVTAQAAEFIKVDNLPWCIEAAKVAFDLATGTVKEGWDITKTAKHIKFGDEPVPEAENIFRAMFALLLATDIHNALDYVALDPKTPKEEYASRATQVMLESCAYQYGKNVAGKK